MNSFYGKLFASVMALVLAVLPLQGVSAPDVSESCHSVAMPHHMGDDAGADMAMEMEHDCVQVVCDDCSAAGHCAACITGLISALTSELPITPEIAAMVMKTGEIRNISSSLYRPPRT